MRYILILAVLAATVLGCARDVGIPTLPDTHDPSGALQSQSPYDLDDGPYRLWGEWTFFFNAEHDRVDVVPRRQARMHLNVLVKLEEYCTNCLEIINVKNNGDETIDLTVRISHPFTGFPEYTGFDVKGIIMFNGSYEYSNVSDQLLLPEPFFRVSWREMGDPEVLNPDGYTPRWRPNWDWGSDMPIFSYWEGKYATGDPNADLNAFLNFYSHEERHMFLTDSHVQRTYHIWLPPGEPVVAAYAVEACWEPPTVMPVTNPSEDFPPSANQPEAYHFKWVVNNGEVITDCDECCGNGIFDCSDLYIEQTQWGGMKSDRVLVLWPDGGGMAWGLWECEPAQESRFAVLGGFNTCSQGNGTHRIVSWNYWFDGKTRDFAYSVFDVTVNDPDL